MKTRHGLAFVLVLAGCGGNVVVDRDGIGGGTTGTTTGTGTTGTGTTGTGTTGIGCTTHEQCPGNTVCVFQLGQCMPSCEPDTCGSCGPGRVCDQCATSSCPGCEDCKAACMPVQQGRCDDDDPCPAGQVCTFNNGFCAPACKIDADCGGFSFCADCVTGSCCGCLDCVSACVGGE